MDDRSEADVISAVELLLEANLNGEGRIQDLDAAVDALLVAELLAADEAEEWRNASARARSADQAACAWSASDKARAEELLKQLHAEAWPRSDPDWDPARYARFDEARTMLSTLGLLSPQDGLRWGQRGEALLHARPGHRQTPVVTVEAALPFAAGQLTCVAAGPAKRIAGLRIVNVELYDDCLMLRKHHELPEEPEDPVEARELLFPEIGLTDDLGTIYEPATARYPDGCCPPPPSVEWSRVRSGVLFALPAVPLGAHELIVSWRDDEITIALHPESTEGKSDR